MAWTHVISMRVVVTQRLDTWLDFICQLSTSSIGN